MGNTLCKLFNIGCQIAENSNTSECESALRLINEKMNSTDDINVMVNLVNEVKNYINNEEVSIYRKPTRTLNHIYSYKFHELISLFYELKNNTWDRISDQALIAFMKNEFNNHCQFFILIQIAQMNYTIMA